MHALRLHAPGDVRYEEVARPSPGAGEVLVDVRMTGLCGTDLAVYGGEYPIDRPLVVGHELVGVVAATGPGVTGVTVGQRVGSEASWRCRDCPGCTDGTPCWRPRSLGRSVDGCAAASVVVPVTALHAVPDEVSDLAAQALVTVATTARALALVPDTAEVVTIVGSGHAGLLMVQQLASTRPGVRIVLLGTRPGRLVLGRDCGAHECVNVRDPTERAAHAERTARGGVGAAAVDATGTGDGLTLALEATSYGGRVVAYSVYPSRLEIEGLQLLYQRALELVGSRGGAGHYDEALALLRDGLLRPELLAADPVPLSEGPALFAALAVRAVREPRAVLSSEEAS